MHLCRERSAAAAPAPEGRKTTATMPLDLDWNSIHPLNGSKRDAFEELCTQLARAECPADARYERT
jgi:hypothetical protein